MIREPEEDYSRLRDQALRKHDFAWWKCKRDLKETLLSRANGASAQSTVDGTAELRKVGMAKPIVTAKAKHPLCTQFAAY